MADFNIYKEMNALFYSNYTDIKKLGNSAYIDISEQLMPKSMEELLATQFREIHPKEYHLFLQSSKEHECISKSNLSRIKQKAKKDFKRNLISQNSLNLELDEKVKLKFVSGR